MGRPALTASLAPLGAATEFLAGGGEMGLHIRAHGWHETSLGPPDEWPPELRTLVRVMLASRQAMFVVWGPDRTLIYNDAYLTFLGDRHPGALGEDFRAVWHGRRDLCEETIDRAYGGEAVCIPDVEIAILRGAYQEASAFQFSCTPVLSVGQHVAGVFCVCVDTTARVRAERRQAFLLDLADRLQGADDAERVVLAVADSLGKVLGANRIGHGYVMDDGSVVVRHDWTDGSVTSIVGQHRLSDFGESLVTRLTMGRTAVTSDVLEESNSLEVTQAFRGVAVRGSLTLPLLRDGALSSLLFIHTAAPRRWSEDEIALVAEVGRRMRAAEERQRTQALLREGEARFRRMADTTPVLIWATDAEGRMTFANRRFEEEFGTFATNFQAKVWPKVIHPEDAGPLEIAFTDAVARRVAFQTEVRARNLRGEMRRLRCEGVPRIEGGVFLGHVGCSIDITETSQAAELLEARVADRTAELQRAEEALRQAQKMEAIGQLTGGIAHDFNNLLQGISGSLDLIQTRIAQGRLAAVGPFLKSASASAGRAAALTHRLLAFARRQPIDPRPVQPNDLIAEMKGFFRRSCGESVRLDLSLQDGLWNTLCDANQLENALLNLVINARDAMPEGGVLTVATTCFHHSAEVGSTLRDLAPGDYVQISVADTGTGMAPSVVERAFEPFFTTKPVGQGTGLGLSMIYGFARQSEGDARIVSCLGEGTRVELFLPRHEGPLQLPVSLMPQEVEALPRPSHGEVVVVVEDDPVVRQVVVEVLIERGYAVLQAGDGAAGRRLIEKLSRFDLLITDIGLAGCDGRQLAALARQRQPAQKVLFMTGYAETAAQAQGFLEPGMEMIIKPFGLDVLAARVHALLEGE